MRKQRGFTLIELGIVIGVIAVLAMVVLVGRGFMESERVSKVVEAVNAVQKSVKVYVGHSAGTFRAAEPALLNSLQSRALIPFGEGAATFVPGFTFVSADASANTSRFVIQITCQ